MENIPTPAILPPRKRICKRRRGHLSQIWEENRLSSWEMLPDLAVIRILSYLSKPDRYRMAQTCKRWAKLFHSPVLWRQAKVDFSDHKLTSSELKCLYAHSRHIKSLEIILWKNFGFNNRLSLKHVPQLVKVLSSSKLQHLHLSRLNVGAYGRNWPTASVTVSALSDFLSSQDRLRKVKLSNLRVEESDGLNIIRAMASRSSQKVQNLDITGLFRSGALLNDKLENIIGKFCNLKELLLNYSCLSDGVISTLAENASRTLRLISVEAYGDEPHGHRISTYSWKHLQRTCPNLRVNLSIEFIPTFGAMSVILTPGIPLQSLSIWTGRDEEDDVRLPDLLIELGNNLCGHLESVCIQLDNRNTAINEELLYFVKRCKKLLSLDLTANVNIDVVENVCSLRTDGKIGLNRFHLILYDSYGEENSELVERLRHLRGLVDNMKTPSSLDYKFFLSSETTSILFAEGE